jgi:hypothetical protein
MPKIQKDASEYAQSKIHKAERAKGFETVGIPQW